MSKLGNILSNRNGGAALGLALTIGIVMGISVVSLQKAANFKNRQALRMLNSSEGFYNSELGAWHMYYKREGGSEEVDKSNLIISDADLRASIRRYREGGIKGWVKDSKFCGSASFDPIPGNYETCLVPPPTSCSTCPKIFATSNTYGADFGGKWQATAYCNLAAEAAGLNEGYWKAILSTSSSDTDDGITVDGDVFNLNGDLVATASNFWNADHANAVAVDEFRTAISTPPHVWTGVRDGGSDWINSDNCNDWSTTSSGARGYVGSAKALNKYWLADNVLGCDNEARFLCISRQVKPADPTADIKANGNDGPISAAAGDSVTLTWTSTNAENCTIGDGTTGLGSGTSGSLVVRPATTTRYAITCSRPGFPDGTDAVQVTVGGSTDHIIFLTSTLHTGNMNGLSGADSICETQAASSSNPNYAGKTWKAILSTNSINAKDRIILSGNVVTYSESGGIYTSIAVADASGLRGLFSGNLRSNGVRYDERGRAVGRIDSNALGYEDTWTASTNAGTYTNAGGGRACGGWTSDAKGDRSGVGNSQRRDGMLEDPTTGKNDSSSKPESSCDEEKRILCISQGTTTVAASGCGTGSTCTAQFNYTWSRTGGSGSGARNLSGCGGGFFAGGFSTSAGTPLTLNLSWTSTDGWCCTLRSNLLGVLSTDPSGNLTLNNHPANDEIRFSCQKGTNPPSYATIRTTP